ncbi:Protein kinase-like domain [Cordyceps militaris CM01]|uniref:Protein kinase-like domain n=1 Tax=Cordyceps militaris (strain CM01) TaxID=983644 RepID=G3JBR4_CORMM|nr:Protein kinase-like domain [Cordyceps militaris CM01]EGX93690.1 Protein kinase-like domain [Cordyceps militaris CM01]
MSSWARWITALWRPVVFCAGFASLILWVSGNHRDEISTEQDIESDQNSFLSIGDASQENASQDQIKPRKDELQTSLYTLGAGTSSDLIGVGVFTHVYNLGQGRVRKVPAPDPDNLALALESIRKEGDIYEHLGNHPRVVKCLAKGDLFVDLEFAPYGHLEDYLKIHHDISDSCRIQFAQEIIEAVVFIHSKGIVHSDLAARQFLVDEALHVRLSDFGFSGFGGGDVLGFENSSHHLPRDIDGDMPSSIQSDLFALGSTLYEVITSTPPYQGKSDDVIVHLYSSRSFPDVTGILCGHIITGCWQGSFSSAAEVLQGFLGAV